MALPRQVEQTLKDLEALEAQLSKDQDKPAEANTDPAPEPDPEPAEPTPEPTEPVAQEPTATEPSKPVEADAKEEETWRQKYRTLQGMYDAEVPRLHAQVKELSAQMEKLQKREEPEPEKKKRQVEKLVTDADVEAFGQDLIEVQRKVAREVASEFQGELEELRTANETLREQLTKTGSQVSEAGFEHRLHRLVPDFDAVNTNPEWIDWLNEFDPLLRAPRKTVAQDAFSRGDAEAVAHYIGMFKSSVAPVEPPKAKNDELERQIQPNRSASSSAQVSAKGKTYTNAQISSMFQKAADLGGKGKLEEAQKLEAEIDAAYMEGRVRA